MALMQHRVVHIHPTLLCNLACAHCYSTSGPAEPAGLDPKDILHATAQLRDYGVETASLSGGEPTVYTGIDTLCGGLKAQGYGLSIITNGLLTNRALHLSKTYDADVIAISFDGLKPRHDLIRRRQGAFDRALKTMTALSQAGQRTGAILSFGEDGIEDLPELANTVIEAGATKIQFHPVAEVGRGATINFIKAPSAETILRILTMTRVLQLVHPEVTIDCDALTGAALAKRCAPAAGQVVSPVVIASDGWVGPIAYGFAGRFDFGRTGERLAPPVFSENLAALAARVMEEEAKKPATSYYCAFERSVLSELAET